MEAIRRPSPVTTDPEDGGIAMAAAGERKPYLYREPVFIPWSLCLFQKDQVRTKEISRF